MLDAFVFSEKLRGGETVRPEAELHFLVATDPSPRTKYDARG